MEELELVGDWIMDLVL